MSLVILAVRYSIGSFLLLLFKLISPKLRLRARQERHSAKDLRGYDAADIWYHCSSEGELEQIWPIVQRVLGSSNKRQLIWFTSPSLLARAESINKEETLIHMAFLPLVSLFPNKVHPLRLGRPDLFFMVRYDFFAELITVGKLKANRFILLSSTFKGKKRSLLKNPVKKVFARWLYKNFDEIYFATQDDLTFFKQNLKSRIEQKISCHDFRHGQIMARQKSLAELEKTRCLEELKDLITPFQLCDRIILGSSWPNELDLFCPDFLNALKNKEQLVLIAPHKLKGEEWDKFEDWLKQLDELGIEATLWDHVGIHGKANVILCQTPGLLCELYPFFGHCFIGGGHGRSIHSLLEPYWAGGHIYCGPKTQRSTEYSFVVESSPAHIHVVGELKDFYDIFKEKRLFPLDKAAREELGANVYRDHELALSSFCQSGES